MQSKSFISTVLVVSSLATAMTTATSAQAYDAGGVAAAAVFGLAAGAMVGAATSQPARYYHPVPRYVSYYPARSHRVCELRPRYNRWGEEIGARRVCWREVY